MALTWRSGVMLLVSGLLVQTAGAEPVPPGAPAGASPAPAGPMRLDALRQLETGLWQLDVKGNPPRQVCVSDPVNLVQVEHDQPGCTRFVIANEPRSSTVHYSCQRTGWGRTTIRVETPRMAAIHTQGIARNAPFDYTVEARRVGDCAPQTASRQR